MTEKKLYLILQSALCILLVILLAISAVSIYREGRARKAEDPMEWIYTREKTAEKFVSIAPLFFCAIGMTVAGWVLAVKDDRAEKPVKEQSAEASVKQATAKKPVNNNSEKNGINKDDILKNILNSKLLIGTLLNQTFNG